MEPQIRELFAHDVSWWEFDASAQSYRFPIFSAGKLFESLQAIKEAIFVQAYAFECEGLERMLRYRTEIVAGRTIAEFRCKHC